jgi:hypothetical protein
MDAETLSHAHRASDHAMLPSFRGRDAAGELGRLPELLSLPRFVPWSRKRFRERPRSTKKESGGLRLFSGRRVT